MKIKGAHPAAEAWPMLDEPDLRRLAEDIKSNGQRHPIIVTKDGLILDGRNRYAACQIAGVEPVIDVQDPEDPAAFVLSQNNERRHLSLPQRAAATALTLGAEKRSGGRWSRGSVPDIQESLNSKGQWRNLLSQAGVILDHLGPDPLRRVAGGELALDAAYQQANEVKAEKAKRNSLPDDLGALVDSGQLTIPEALRRAALPDSYRQRVADGGLSLDEAERLTTQEERDRHDAIRRDVERLKSFLHGIYTAATLDDNPDRDPILDGLDDYDRDRILTISKEITWPTTTLI